MRSRLIEDWARATGKVSGDHDCLLVVILPQQLRTPPPRLTFVQCGAATKKLDSNRKISIKIHFRRSISAAMARRYERVNYLFIRLWSFLSVFFPYFFVFASVIRSRRPSNLCSCIISSMEFQFYFNENRRNCVVSREACHADGVRKGFSFHSANVYEGRVLHMWSCAFQLPR